MPLRRDAASPGCRFAGMPLRRDSPTIPKTSGPKTSGPKMSGGAGHDSDDAGGFVDELDELAALEVLGDVGEGERGGARGGLARVARELDGAAHLAVDLHRQRHRGVEGEGFVPRRPRRLEEK